MFLQFEMRLPVLHFGSFIEFFFQTVEADFFF